MFDSLRNFYARFTHWALLRRQAMGEAWLRWRPPEDTQELRPSRMSGWMDNVGGCWQGFWAWVARPWQRLRDRARWRAQAMQDMAAPLSAAAGNAQGAQRLRSRWWDPMLVGLLHYGATRPRREMLRGVPALGALIVCTGVALMVSGLRPSATRYTSLLSSAELAMSNQDYPKALIAYERMLQVGHLDSATQFSLARCLAAMKEYQRAAQLLYALAPDDAAGYPPAHRERALMIMNAPNVTTADLELARQHLKRVLDADPKNNEAHGLMASLLLMQKDLQGARNEFVESTDKRPDMALNAAMLSRKLGDAKGVADNASIAVVYYQGELKKVKENVPATTVLSLAQALSLQNKYRDAIGVLEDYVDKTPAADREKLVAGIMQICDVWQQEIENRKAAEDLDRLFVVKAVLAQKPKEHQWQLRLLDLASDKSLVRPAALKVLEQLARDQTAGAEVCFFLGMEALHRENYSDARDYLERSWALLPGYPPTANNLACALLEGKDPNPARALELVGEALKAAPNYPVFRETRGEALVALGRWEEGAAELEKALPGLEDPRDRRQAHLKLALAYEKLGQSDKAQQHKTLALTDKGP